MQRLFFISLLFLVGTADAQVVTFQRTYGGGGEEYSFSVQQTADSGYVVAGYSNGFGVADWDYYVVKTNQSGDTLWTKTYGRFSADQCYSVRQTADNGYILAGFSNSFNGGIMEDICLIRTDANGDTLWTRTYGGGGFTSDEGFAVKETSDNGFIVAGSTNSFSPFGAYAIKVDSVGDTLWTRIYGGAGARDVQETIDGGFIITGSATGGVYLIKTNNAGDTVWTKTYGSAGSEAGYAVQQTTDNGYIIAGWIDTTGSGDWNVLLLKGDSLGNLLWSKSYGGSGDDYGYSVNQTNDGGYIVAGYTNSFGGGMDDAYLIRTDPNGDTLWTRTYGGIDMDRGFSVQQTIDNGYILSGYTMSYGAPWFDYYLIKTDANGNSGCNEYSTATTIITPTLLVGSGGTISSGTNIDTTNAIVLPTPTYPDIQCDSVLLIGIEQFVFGTCKLYPNPTTGKFTVQGTATEIQVYDLFGRLVLETPNKQVDMSSYPAGIYIVKAGAAVRRLILH